MPTLAQSLPANDPAFLRIAAELWGLELESEPDAEQLGASLLDPGLAREIQETLPAEARTALDALREAGGRLPWPVFARRFGEIREAGPGRRDRERLYLKPVSVAETLFFRVLIARAFFDTPSGPQEFAYIPDDLLPLIIHEEREIPLTPTPLPKVEGSNMTDEPLGRPASPKEREHPLAASDRILDDLTTLLAALRMGMEPLHSQMWRYPVPVLMDFLAAARLTVNSAPQPEPVRAFLEATRKDALKLLAKPWRESETFNELRQIPGLVCEGEWKNDPLGTRDRLMGFLGDIPRGQWWSLPAFVRAVKEKAPDFQRPAGEYDSWFVKRADDGVYLRGFERWDEVDGALIRYLISRPLFWLGIVDLACAEEGGSVTAFRVNEKRVMSSEAGKLTVTSDGRIRVPRNAPRVARYLLARFCEWEDEKPDEYRYRVSTRSLKKAQAQGLKVSQLLSLLAKHASAEIPPVFVKALKRWEVNGTEARVETQAILRVSRPEVLDELRKSKAGRFLGELLGPTAVIVKGGAVPKVLAALAELGLLAEVDNGLENGEKTDKRM